MGVSINEFYRLAKEGKIPQDVSFREFSSKVPTTEKRSTLIDDSWCFRNFPQFGISGANVQVSPYNAMGLTAYRRCVELRGTGMASLKIRLIKQDGTSKEVVTKHPALDIIRRPNAYMTEYSWRFWMESVRVGRGNSYSWIRRDGNGRPVELVPIWNPDNMQPYLQTGICGIISVETTTQRTPLILLTTYRPKYPL